MAKKEHERAHTERELLRKLQENCAQSNLQLAADLNIDNSSLSRMRASIGNKYKLSYKAVVEPESFGFMSLAFIHIALKKEGEFRKTSEILESLPEVQEIHYVNGPFDFLLKVRTRSTKELFSFEETYLKSTQNIKEWRTVIVMKTAKETSDIPI